MASREIRVRRKGKKREAPSLHGVRTPDYRRQGQACPLQTPIEHLSPPLDRAPRYGLRWPGLPRDQRPCRRVDCAGGRRRACVRACGRAATRTPAARRAFQGAPRHSHVVGDARIIHDRAPMMHIPRCCCRAVRMCRDVHHTKTICLCANVQRRAPHQDHLPCSGNYSLPQTY